jgi:hypothetical protein
VKLLFFSILLCSHILFAQSTYLKMDPKKPVKVDYQAKSWNKSPDKIDTAAILFRDAGSGRLAKIEMQESEANSGYFIGFYQIGFRPDADVLPEVYVVPQKMLSSQDQLKKIEQLIKEGTLLKKPFFLRQESSALQAISVFDTREQAVQAYQDHKSSKPIVDRAALEAQQRAKMAAEKLKMEELAKVQALERQRIEAEEKRKIEEMKRKQLELDAATKLARQKQAKELAEQAMALYRKEDFVGAEAKFAKSTELDPENNTYYYQYGVTLYKNEKFNQSLVALNLAVGKEVNPVEREFYIALNHMKLKEFDSAYKEFLDVKNKNYKTISPSAAFFAGVIDFQKERYDESQKLFEYTLDNSEDVRMDEQAEAYIEQIANIKSFLANKAKKFIFTGNLGLMHDSNITNAADGTSTNLSGFRWVYGGSFEYRPIYTQAHEFSAVLAINDMYTTTSGFKAEAAYQNTDPLTTSFSFPYKFKGLALGKPYQMTLSPAIESTNLNSDGSGARERIVDSTVLKNDHTFVMNEDWFSTYSLEFRNDNSKIDTTTTPAENQTATKITLSTNQTFFKNKKKTEATIYDFAIANNAAKGDNQKYQKIDLGIGYTMPWNWGTTWNGKVSIGQSTYGSHASSRKDMVYTLTTGLQKPINDNWASSGNLTYTNNGSNLDANKYSKYTLMLGMSCNY